MEGADGGRERLIGRMAAALLCLSGLVILASLALPTPASTDPAVNAVVGLTATAVGLVSWFLPWHRWRRSASLWLVPFAFALIAFNNHFGGIDRLRYGVFFVVAFTWIGASQPRWTSLRFVPLYALAFVAPLVTSGHYAPTIFGAAIVNGLVCVLVSETLAWMSAQLRRAQGDLDRRQTEARFRSLVQHSSDIVTIVDRDGIIVYQSPSVERVLGYGPAELVGTRLTAVLHAEDVPRALDFVAEIASRPAQGAPADWRMLHRNGSWLYVETIGNDLRADPNVRGIVLNSRDITERRALEAQLTHQAFHDPLTNLANRSLFKERVEHALTRADRNGGSLAVLFADLDDFKTINDSLGHAAGDALLLAVAERLRDCLRSADTAARLGGDEFAILLEGVGDASSASQAAERILAALRPPFALQGKEVRIRASLGIAMWTDGREGVDEILRNADVAMYMAKSRGKGFYAQFEPSMHTAILERLDLQADLQRAVERQELTLLYQPIVALQSGRIVGMEALVRWAHPERGLVSPAGFIPLAEETGLILPIGRWVLREACRQARQWQKRGSGPPRWMSINLSARQLQEAGLVDEVAQALRDSGLAPRGLILEVTESVLMQDTEATVGKLRALKRLGVRLAIDDFGTGYSSLSYLQHFPIDILKMDKSFVDNVETGAEGSTLVQTIITLGRTLRMQTVAEGIERSEHADRLRRLGCDLGQGYHFARPLTADAGAELLAANRGEPTTDNERRTTDRVPVVSRP